MIEIKEIKCPKCGCAIAIEETPEFKAALERRLVEMREKMKTEQEQVDVSQAELEHVHTKMLLAQAEFSKQEKRLVEMRCRLAAKQQDLEAAVKDEHMKLECEVMELQTTIDELSCRHAKVLAARDKATYEFVKAEEEHAALTRRLARD